MRTLSQKAGGFLLNFTANVLWDFLKSSFPRPNQFWTPGTRRRNQLDSSFPGMDSFCVISTCSKVILRDKQIRTNVRKSIDKHTFLQYNTFIQNKCSYLNGGGIGSRKRNSVKWEACI